MPAYIVTIGHTVYEQGSVVITAPNKRAALKMAKDADPDEINWNYNENETDPEVVGIMSEDGKELDLDDDDDEDVGSAKSW